MLHGGLFKGEILCAVHHSSSFLRAPHILFQIQARFRFIHSAHNYWAPTVFQELSYVLGMHPGTKKDSCAYADLLPCSLNDLALVDFSVAPWGCAQMDGLLPARRMFPAAHSQVGLCSPSSKTLHSPTTDYAQHGSSLPRQLECHCPQKNLKCFAQVLNITVTAFSLTITLFYNPIEGNSRTYSENNYALLRRQFNCVFKSSH